MFGRRTFRILSYSQLSGIKVKAVIKPKYNNLYIVMIQCAHYKNYYAFKASNDSTHRTKQYTQIQLNLQLVIKIFYITLFWSPPHIDFTHSPQPLTFRLFTTRVNASHPDHFDYLTLHHIHFVSFHYSWWSPLHSTIFTALRCHTTLRFLAFTSLHITTLHFLAFPSLHFT